MDKHELRDLVLSWIVLTFAFSFNSIINRDFEVVASYAIAVMLGFVFHEMMHRKVAQRYGAIARYRAWYMGLLLAVVVSVATMGRFVIAAPGAVEIVLPPMPYGYLVRITAAIAASGPFTNLLISIFALPFHLLLKGYTCLPTIVGEVNAILALFNLIPLPPLDGWKVFRYSPLAWLLFFLASALVTIVYVLS